MQLSHQVAGQMKDWRVWEKKRNGEEIALDECNYKK